MSGKVWPKRPANGPIRLRLAIYREIAVRRYSKTVSRTKGASARNSAAIEQREQWKISVFQSGVSCLARLNSATRQTCVLLSTESESDWECSETQAQSCDCKEFFAGDVMESERPKREYKKQWEQRRQLFCGNGLVRAAVSGSISRRILFLRQLANALRRYGALEQLHDVVF